QKCYLRCAVSEAKLIWDVIRITPQSLCCLWISCEAVTYALVWSSGFRPRTEKKASSATETQSHEKNGREFHEAQSRNQNGSHRGDAGREKKCSAGVSPACGPG